MSLTKNNCIRCDWCGRLTRNRNGEYTKPDGVSAGYIHQPEWERFPGGDHTKPNEQTDHDICEECAERFCWKCGTPKPCPQHPETQYWTEAEAGDNIELPRCIHGIPRNVFCGKCES